jgi:YVTN family beta-propeller protein
VKLRVIAWAIIPALCSAACGGGVPTTVGTSPATAASAVLQKLLFNPDAPKQTLYAPKFASDVVTTYDMRGQRTPVTIREGLDGPFGVAVDAGGKIYVTNTRSNSVTTYLPDGTQTTPTITAGISEPLGVTVDKHGKIYVVNRSPSSCGSGSVPTYKSDGTQTTPTIDIPGTPVGIVVDAYGKIYGRSRALTKTLILSGFRRFTVPADSDQYRGDSAAP